MNFSYLERLFCFVFEDFFFFFASLYFVEGTQEFGLPTKLPK